MQVSTPISLKHDDNKEVFLIHFKDDDGSTILRSVTVVVDDPASFDGSIAIHRYGAWKKALEIVLPEMQEAIREKLKPENDPRVN